MAINRKLEYTYHMRIFIAVLSFLLILVSCNLPDYFEEYTDSDGNPINLIDGFVLPPDPGSPTVNQNTGTKTVVIDSETIAIPDPASWDISYGNDAITYNYLGFNHSGETPVTGVTGIEDGSEIYYLSVTDLAPANMTNSSSWSGTALSGTGPLTVDLLPSEFASYPINAGLADSPGASPATYCTAIHFDSCDIFNAYVEGCSWDLYNPTGTATDTTIYLTEFVNDTGLLFYLGAPAGIAHQIVDCTIDSFSITRTDIEYNFEFYIPEFAEGRPPIIDGKYRFSVWVRKDSDAGTADIESLTLGITSYNTNNAYFESFTADDYIGEWADWTRIDLVTTIDSSVQLNPDNPSDFPAVVLTISPRYLTHSLGAESTLAGTIWFTSPALYFVTE